MSDLEALFRAQREAWRDSSPPDLARRRDMLGRLQAAVLSHADALADAAAADFGRRARAETRLAEILTVSQEITHIRRHLGAWMRPQRVSVDWTFWPGRAWIRYEPLGVVGVIGAWNYPIVLSLSPLANALSAGNRVMLKLPERTPATNEVLETLLIECFPPAQVATVTGDASVGEAFARLPFNHLLFTGSSAVGRRVYSAAAPQLTPVTLELGGKSPALVDLGFSLRVAAERIATGKFLNAGQTCIAPDYVLLPRGALASFEHEFKRAFARLYPGGLASPDYTWIINQAHCDRLTRLLEDARSKGARLVPLVTGDVAGAGGSTRAFSPTLVLDGRPGMAVLEEEIFGPILPLIPYDTIDEAIRQIEAGPAPLVLYYFGHDPQRREEVMRRTRSGGVVVNDTLIHFVQGGLPFGGVGESGIGHYHGIHGFRTFSKARGVFRQGRWNGFALLRPPYGRRTERLVDFLIRRR